MKIKIRQAILADIEDILIVEKASWGSEQAACREMFASRIKVFPEGTLVAELENKIIGVVVAEIVNYDFETQSFTWYEITDHGFIKNSHNINGDTLYGVNLCVSPEAPNGTGLKLIKAATKIAVKYNLKRIMLGGRMPMYYKYKDRYSAEEYLQQTIIEDGKEFPPDPQVRFYIKAGLKIWQISPIKIKIIPNYFKDPKSCDYGVLLVWENPFYKPFK